MSPIIGTASDSLPRRVGRVEHIKVLARLMTFLLLQSSSHTTIDECFLPGILEIYGDMYLNHLYEKLGISYIPSGSGNCVNFHSETDYSEILNDLPSWCSMMYFRVWTISCWSSASSSC